METIRCKDCGERKPAAEFDLKAVSRAFRTCKRCHSRRGTERRRSDPATRLISRARVREKRRGRERMSVSISHVRDLLRREEDPRYAELDLLSLERERAEEPLSALNAFLKRVGRIVEVRGADPRGGSCARSI